MNKKTPFFQNNYRRDWIPRTAKSCRSAITDHEIRIQDHDTKRVLDKMTPNLTGKKEAATKPSREAKIDLIASRRQEIKKIRN